MLIGKRPVEFTQRQWTEKKQRLVVAKVDLSSPLWRNNETHHLVTRCIVRVDNEVLWRKRKKGGRDKTRSTRKKRTKGRIRLFVSKGF
ncbi:unnamed protein product [Soboliphyme baturini]|uniref:Uncharacterized protein n=1 Tax=Soboliphyme baturini TaxID=241478 RepID=A0A183IJ42_9BILA|nr:unnamed protein product [Soboliphyme baturini]